MDEEPEEQPKKRPRRRWVAILGSVFGTIVTLTIVGAAGLTALVLFHPDAPIPPEWNPNAQLRIDDPVTPVTSWKLRRALADPAQCLAALETGADFAALDPFEENENCHIRNRITLSGAGQSQINTLDTSCAIGLRFAMWERHGVQPAARELFGSQVTTIRQIGSYNCRQIRTAQGPSDRWSTHSTADAIDITGFDFTDGRRIRLIDDWDGDAQTAAFLRAVRDSACTWFATTLGPDFNQLHADHFHLQARGWGTCQ